MVTVEGKACTRKTEGARAGDEEEEEGDGGGGGGGRLDVVAFSFRSDTALSFESAITCSSLPSFFPFIDHHRQ